MNEKWFALTIEEIEKKLKTNATRGLLPKVARSRSQNLDAGTFYSVKKKKITTVLLELISDFFLIMLLLVAVLTLFFDRNALVGSALLVLIAVNLSASFYISYRDNKSTKSLCEFFLPTARVIRDGKLYICDCREVVPGDVIIIEKGDLLAFDARLVHSSELVVKMQIDKKRSAVLKKFAGATQSAEELSAENMENMVHAGSLVTAGSARAIVVGVGSYTYLGARVGGIVESPLREPLQTTQNVRKIASRIGIWLLILMLPFSLVSLLFAHFTGGTVLLSEVLAAALAFGAVLMLSRFSNMFFCFFVEPMRRSAMSKKACIVRSPKALEDLAELDYLFLLDGSIATDGVQHLSVLATADGENGDFENLSGGAAELRDMISMYALARRAAPSSGVSHNSFFDIALGELLEKSHCDTEALGIRCKIASYLAMADREGRDRLIYTDCGQRRELNVSFDGKIIDECTFVRMAENEYPLTDDGRDTLKRRYRDYMLGGKRVLVFSLRREDTSVFCGMMVLEEGVDASVRRASEMLRDGGVKIISFTACKDRVGAPELPMSLRRGKRAYADDYAIKQISIESGFGEIDEYYGFGERDIARLAEFANSQGKKIAVLGFTDYAAECVRYADVFISCAPIRTNVFGRFLQEIKSLEVTGEESSASCTQNVRAHADVLLGRPNGTSGGLEPLARAVEYGRIAKRNLKNFLVYIIATALVHITSVMIPMLFGRADVDGRHIVFFGFIFALFSMLIFMGERGRVQRGVRDEVNRFFSQTSVLGLLNCEKALFISAAAGGAAVVVIPEIADLVRIFGNYIYRTEYIFLSLAILEILVLMAVYSKRINNAFALKRLVKNPYFIAMVSVFAVLYALSLLTPLGRLFGIIGILPWYLLFSILPSGVFLLCFYLLGSKAGKRRGSKEDK